MVPTTSRFLRSLCHWMPLKRERISLIFDKVIFDLQGHGGCWRPKTPLRGQKMHEGVNLLKKVFNESCSVTSKTPYRIQSDFSYDLQVERYSMPPCPSHFRHAVASKVCMRLCSYTAAAAGSNILPI